jgi:Ca2+-binding EF-hand superfamily protein
MQKYLLIVASTLLCGAALAQGQTPSQKPTFESLDANADQKISSQEAKTDSKLSEHFSGLDANKDGYLDPMEFSKYARS